MADATYKAPVVLEFLTVAVVATTSHAAPIRSSSKAAQACETFLSPPLFSIDEGNLKVTLDARYFWKGHPILVGSRKMTPAKQRLLVALVDRKNQFVSREELVADTWPGFELDPADADRKLTYLVIRLRDEFLGVDPGFSSLITKREIGYAWDTGERENVLELDGIRLHPDLFELELNHHRVILSPGRFRVLRELASHPGKPYPLEDIYTLIVGEKRPKRMEKNQRLLRMSAKVEMIRLEYILRSLQPGFDRLKKGHPIEDYWWER